MLLTVMFAYLAHGDPSFLLFPHLLSTIWLLLAAVEAVMMVAVAVVQEATAQVRELQVEEQQQKAPYL
jgi:hypothetical protein